VQTKVLQVLAVIAPKLVVRSLKGNLEGDTDPYMYVPLPRPRLFSYLRHNLSKSQCLPNHSLSNLSVPTGIEAALIAEEVIFAQLLPKKRSPLGRRI